MRPQCNSSYVAMQAHFAPDVEAEPWERDKTYFYISLQAN